MIDAHVLPLLRKLWPIFAAMGRRYKVDARMLLALAYIQSLLDASARSAAGAVGLMQMMPDTADDVAKRLRRTSYDLVDPATAVEFAAAYLGSMEARFGLPRLALAAYVAGPRAVQEAGGQVPPGRDVQRTVTSVMTLWRWLQQNIEDVLDSPAEEASTTTSSTAAVAIVPKMVTTTSADGASSMLAAPAWRLIVPPDNWQHPIAIDASSVPSIEELASRMKLAFRRDDVARKVYLGPPRVDKPPAVARGRLIVPVPGADASNNAAYSGDTGLDILAPVGSPVVAAGSGTLVYSEPGHTQWSSPPDTPNSVLIMLDTPFQYKGSKMPYIWYTHLSKLRYHVSDGSAGTHVAQGELLGWTGVGNRVPHLHFGVVQDRPQTVFVPPFALAAYFGWG